MNKNIAFCIALLNVRNINRVFPLLQYDLRDVYTKYNSLKSLYTHINRTYGHNVHIINSKNIQTSHRYFDEKARLQIIDFVNIKKNKMKVNTLMISRIHDDGCIDGINLFEMYPSRLNRNERIRLKIKYCENFTDVYGVEQKMSLKHTDVPIGMSYPVTYQLDINKTPEEINSIINDKIRFSKTYKDLGEFDNYIVRKLKRAHNTTSSFSVSAVGSQDKCLWKIIPDMGMYQSEGWYNILFEVGRDRTSKYRIISCTVSDKNFITNKPILLVPASLWTSKK